MPNIRICVLCSVSLGALGCAGAQPATQPPAAAAAPSSSSVPAPEAKPSAVASAESPPPAAEPPASGEKPSRPPVDTITAPKVAFQINYESSAPGEAAEKKCDAAAGDDSKAKALCMKKERSEFYADVVRFKKDDADKVWFITYRRMGSQLILLHKTQVDLKNDGDAAVKVQIVGDDKAVRVLFPKSKSFGFRVPNDYSIEIDEPRLGKLVYDAKLDLVTK
jgi:hypothetical protein